MHTPFRFYPELFEARNRALAALAEGGFQWFSDFGSIDLEHDVYGLSVTGIREQTDAKVISQLMRRHFRSWPYVHVHPAPLGSIDPGWRVVISKLPSGPNSTPGGNRITRLYQCWDENDLLSDVPTSSLLEDAMSHAKQYRATITIRRPNSGTATITDYCQASSTGAASRTFESRYPDATSISGVTAMQ
jgi:hypothetical protein